MTPNAAAAALQADLMAKGHQVRVRPAMESGIPVLQVISNSQSLQVPTQIAGHVVVKRPTHFIPPAKYDDYGPVNHLAQSWTPHGVARRVWESLIAAGFHPIKHPIVYDLAAGHGRLIEGIAGFCKLVLNDIEEEVTNILSSRFPTAKVFRSDFRKLTPQMVGYTTCIVGSPPWIEDNRGYLPAQYIEKAEELLLPGGLAAFVLPDWFVPQTGMKHISTIRPTMEERGNAVWQWTQQPIVTTYRK